MSESRVMLFVRGEDDPQIPGKVRAGMRPYVVQAILAGMNYCRDGVFCDEKGTRLSERSADGEKVTGRWRRGMMSHPTVSCYLATGAHSADNRWIARTPTRWQVRVQLSARKPARTGV